MSDFVHFMLCVCFVVFCFVSIDAHAQVADDLLVHWTIEGQQQHNAESEKSVDGENVIVIIEEISATPENMQSVSIDEKEEMSNFKYDSFVSGNQYAIGDYKISIFSEEGQILNQVIIDQRDIQTESFRHKIKYHDRFSDGYVELAEALLDPLGKQTYFIGGSIYDYNINSNLELFVLERGYSLDNLQAVPNYIFSPMEFTLGRALLDDAVLAGKGAGDLRVYSSNHRIFEDSEIKSKMIDSLSEQNFDITSQLLIGNLVEISSEPELYTLTAPLSSLSLSAASELDDIEQTASNIAQSLFDDIEFTALKFEDAGRVRIAVENYDDNTAQQLQIPVASVTLLQQDVTRLYVVLLLVSTAVGLASFGYVMWQKTRKKRVVIVDNSESLLLLDSPSHGVSSDIKQQLDYKIITRELLSDAQNLHNKKCHKEAYEILGQAIRLFYSYHLNLQQQGLLTNEELLWQMQQQYRHSVFANSKEYESVKKWLVVCGSVEYAKYTPDAEIFANILDEFSSIVNG